MKKFIVVFSFWVVFCATIILSYFAFFPLKYKNIISEQSKIYEIDESLIASIIFVESRFNRKARSDKGAFGLMQLMPRTAKNFYVGEQDFSEELLFNPEINLNIGIKFLSYLFDKYDDEITVLACYNAGEGNVLKWSGGNKTIKKSQIIFEETLNYIKSVQTAKKIYKHRF